MMTPGGPQSTSAQRSLVDRYALPPQQIEALSLQRVDEALGPRASWSHSERQVARRLVYAAGDAGLASRLRFSTDAVGSGIRALRQGAEIIVDVRMVEVALDQSRARKLGCSIVCRIDDPTVVQDARANQLPRAVSAMRALTVEHPDGIFVVGNAPTALLALLDLVDEGIARPALVIGMPVGFVAAAESKSELATRNVPFITIMGTRGGSAVAAAAANALLRLACDPP